MPAVSVVIPAYNASATLAETLASLSAQTFDDFDAIVVDDGSSDDTGSVAAGTGDARIRVVSTPNGGVARARNHAISQARGAFVAFLDADDLWEPQKLEQQVAALGDDPEAGVCVTGAFRIDKRSQVFATMPLPRPDDICRTLLLNAMAVGYISSGLVRKSVLDTVGGFDPRFSYCADWDLWLRLSTATQFKIVEEPLTGYRTYAGSMSSDARLLERDTFAVLDAFFATPASAPYSELRAQVYGTHWMICAGSYLHQHRLAGAVRSMAHGIAEYPPSVSRPLGVPRRLWRRLTTTG
jgi:glycosyltransferase involved in cell wall biosynthesis